MLYLELDRQIYQPDDDDDSPLELTFAATSTTQPDLVQDVIPRIEKRKIHVPPHRLSVFRASWTKIYSPLVHHLHLQVRFNVRSKAVEPRTSQFTQRPGTLQKGADYVQALVYGFDVEDAIALLRLDDLYLEVFEIRDVRTTLQGSHLSRAIARVFGKDGKTKLAIETAPELD